MTNVSRHRRRHRAFTYTSMHVFIYLFASATICVPPILASTENENATDPIAATNNVNISEQTDNTGIYELPTRIGMRERDDDRETDVDPVEMEGMTAALAKQFAEKLIHKMNEEEEIMRAHESSSSSSSSTSAGSSAGGAIHVLTALLTCFLSFADQLPNIPRSRRRSSQYFIAALFAFVLLVSSLPANAWHHPTVPSSHPFRLARKSVLCATAETPHGCERCLTEPDVNHCTMRVLDPSRRSVMSAFFATAIGSLCVARRAEAADAGGGGSDELYLAQPLGPPGADGKLSRPSAPLEYLVPATRVGVYVYNTLSVAEEIVKLQKESDRSEDSAAKMQYSWAKLDALILSPPPFIKPTDPKVSRGDAYGGAPPIIGEIGMAAQKRRERREQSIDADLASELFEPGQLIGERRQWTQLQKAEMKREAASEVRKALNIYTTNLNFNRNKYSFKGSAEEKSALIRNDRLPTATDVIRSDLDSRDLFRNQMQTSLEDARAEYVYAKKECGGDVTKADLTELMGLLLAAKEAIDKWFSFVLDDDVKKALDVVQQER